MGLITMEHGAEGQALHGSSGPDFNPHEYYVFRNGQLHNGLSSRNDCLQLVNRVGGRSECSDALYPDQPDLNGRPVRIPALEKEGFTKVNHFRDLFDLRLLRIFSLQKKIVIASAPAFEAIWSGPQNEKERILALHVDTPEFFACML